IGGVPQQIQCLLHAALAAVLGSQIPELSYPVFTQHFQRRKQYTAGFAQAGGSLVQTALTITQITVGLYRQDALTLPVTGERKRDFLQPGVATLPVFALLLQPEFEGLTTMLIEPIQFCAIERGIETEFISVIEFQIGQTQMQLVAVMGRCVKRAV